MPQPVATETMVKDTIAALPAGHTYIYHIGCLMFDRKKAEKHDAMVIHGAARAAWDAYEQGLVTLAQRKIGPLKYEYIAIKRTPKEARTPRRRAGGIPMPRVTDRVTNLENPNASETTEPVPEPGPVVVEGRTSGDPWAVHGPTGCTAGDPASL